MNLKKRLKKIGISVICANLIFTSLGSLKVDELKAAQNYNYGKALHYAVQFYDANKCGKDAGKDNVFSWRNACHTKDGSDVGLDLTGGYHDCGDHVKFGITQGYAASVLGWSYYSYKDGYVKAGADTKTLQTLKHFCDYFIKCNPNNSVFYYQLGDGNEDHSYWGAPEKQGARKVIYKVDANNAGSDVAGEASAALSIMYLNYKDIDPAYANKCLKHAKSIYNLGKKKLGCSKGQSFYQTTSYKDDLAWAASWLYTCTKEKNYLKEAEKFISESDGSCMTSTWAMCWNDMQIPTAIRLYQLTGNDKYKKAVKINVDNWMNNQKTTKGGLKFYDSWGSLRYAAAEAFIGLNYYKMTGDQKAKKLAISQINYILGDNPMNLSYIIGYGNKYPTHPHHRAANGYTYDNGGNLAKAKYVLKGALVGGPDENDQYTDRGDAYQYTEVGIDYNAGFVVAVSALLSEKDQKVESIQEDEDMPQSQEKDNKNEKEISGENVTLTVKDQWDQGFVMEVGIHNLADKEIVDWKVVINNVDFKIDNVWNTNDKISSKTLTFEAEEYNKKIPVNGQATFGFKANGKINEKIDYEATITYSDGTKATFKQGQQTNLKIAENLMDKTPLPTLEAERSRARQC